MSVSDDLYIPTMYQNSKHLMAWFMVYWGDPVRVTPFYATGDPDALGTMIPADNLTVEQVKHAVLIRDTPLVVIEGELLHPVTVTEDRAPFAPAMGGTRIKWTPPRTADSERMYMSTFATNELFEDSAIDPVLFVCEDLLRGVQFAIKDRMEKRHE